MICKKCNGEIDKKAVVCVHCGCKIKKPVYKKWWFWVILLVIVVAIGSGSGGEKDTNVDLTATSSESKEEIAYEIVDLQVMIDELKTNAMKAKNNYLNKYVEFDAKINNFDSAGSYIGVEPTNADEWNFDTAMCYIKNDNQKSFLLEKNVGDIVTIKGKVKSVGEVMGYSIDIAEVK